MGGDREVKVGDGVLCRTYPSGKQSLRVEFHYRGVRCRETMKGLDRNRRNHIKFCERLVAEIERKIDMGTFRYTDYFPESKRARIFGQALSNRTVNDVIASWLSDIDRGHPHSTNRHYKTICHGFISPAIGSMRIRDVSVEHLRDMFREAGVVLKTARNYSIPLRAIFQRAIDDDDIERNPMDRINVKTLIPQDKHRTDYVADPFDQDDINSFLAACRKYQPKWVDYWIVAFYTGLRTSELYGLQWPDINWKSVNVRIQRAVVERKVKTPKTKSSIRVVDLVDAAFDALRRQRSRTELKGKAIFLNPDTDKPLSDYEETSIIFDYIQRRAGIRRRNQYQTRHTYASNMLSYGEDPLYVACQMGHKNTQMIYAKYAAWISTDRPQQHSAFGRKEKNSAP